MHRPRRAGGEQPATVGNRSDRTRAAGVVQSDPQARRLAAILPVSEEAIQLYQPLILPISISVLGLLLIAVGAHTPKRRKAMRRRGRRKRQALGRVGRPTAKVLPFKKAT